MLGVGFRLMTATYNASACYAQEWIAVGHAALPRFVETIRGARGLDALQNGGEVKRGPIRARQ